MRLTPDNLGERLKAIDASYEAFRKEDPEMWRWMAESVDGYLGDTTAPPAEAGAAPEF